MAGMLGGSAVNHGRAVVRRRGEQRAAADERDDGNIDDENLKA